MTVDPQTASDAAATADAAIEHTPPPEAPPGVQAVPDAVTPAPHDGLDPIHEAIAAMGERIDTIQSVVMAIADPDQSPSGVPWTHWAPSDGHRS
jgi:hypothetical protein